MKSMKIAGALIALALTSAMATAAAADTYNLTISDAFPSGPTYGVVTTTQAGSNVTVSVALSSGYQFVNTGGGHTAFTFNTNDSTFNLTTDVTSVSSPFDHVFTPGTNPAFGSFTVGMECAACGNGGSNAYGGNPGVLTFTVLNTTLANFVPNSTGFTFSADIIGHGITGAVGNGVPGTPGVPEPATWAMMILGLGMVGAGMRMRRRSVLTPA